MSLIKTLMQHGLSRHAALAVVETGHLMRSTALRRGVEVAAMADVESGAIVGEFLFGEPDRVPIAPLVALMETARRYIQLHTHGTQPTWGPSEEDGTSLVHYEGFLAMGIIGTDGWWYVLSKKPNHESVLPRHLALAWRRTALELLPAFRSRVDRGEMSREQAESLLRHTLWKVVSEEFDLRYDRINSEEGRV